jgi:hypothetical protein
MKRWLWRQTVVRWKRWRLSPEEFHKWYFKALYGPLSVYVSNENILFDRLKRKFSGESFISKVVISRDAFEKPD